MMTGRDDPKCKSILLPAQFALLLWLVLGMPGPVVSASAAAEPSSWVALSEDAQRMLESFGLRELAVTPAPSSYLDDRTASRSLQAHILALRGNYLLRRNQLAAARRHFEDALKISPDNYWVQLALAEVESRSLKDIPTALERCDRLIRDFPDRIQAYELKGRILETSDKIGEAIAVYREAFKRWPNSDWLFDRLPKLALARGDLDLTIEVCTKRLEREPRHFFALWWLGFTYGIKAQEGNNPQFYRESARYYEAALEARPTATKLYPRLAETYDKLNERDKRIATLRRGVVADPSDADIRKAFEAAVSPNQDPDEILDAYRALAEDFPNLPEIIEIYAAQLLARQKIDEARRQFERLLELQPNSIKTLLTLGGLELQANESAKAMKRFERAVELADNDVETFEAIGNLYLRAQKFDEAVRFLERAIEQDPKRTAVYFVLGQAYQEMGKLDKAVEAVQRGLDAAEPARARKPLLLALSSLQQARKNFTEAVKALREAYALDRNDVITFFRLANVLLTADDKTGFDDLIAEGRKTFANAQDEFQETLVALLMDFHLYEQAIPELEALLKRHPKRWTLYVQMATVYQRLRQEANSERLLAEAREKLGGETPDFLRFAWRYYGLRYDSARAYEALRKLLDLSAPPSAPDAAAERIALYESLFFNLGRMKKAEEIARLLERAEREIGSLDPLQMKKLRARALGEMERFDEAVAIYQELIQKDPDNPELHFELGALFHEAKRNEEAERALRRSLELLPPSPRQPAERDLRANVLNHLGYMFAEQGIRLDEARELLTRALEIEPRAGHIIDSLGWLEFKAGNLDKALELIQKALRYSSEDPVLYDHLGDIYAKTGDRDKALENWRQALRLDPALEEVKAKLGKGQK
ncbi:MAG: tetratricopeptide repeat protein [Candidatus Sumerlaeia bacterium]|nr:tetratricopeptide repeat protein [Candidatus Sumerlaeia bacterium]